MNHHCRERRSPNQRNKRLHTKRTTLHFVVKNEQLFPLLLGTKNAFRIFMVLSETKSALVIRKKIKLLPIYSLIFWSFKYFILRTTWLFFGRHNHNFLRSSRNLAQSHVARNLSHVTRKKIIMCEKLSVSGSCISVAGCSGHGFIWVISTGEVRS